MNSHGAGAWELLPRALVYDQCPAAEIFRERMGERTEYGVSWGEFIWDDEVYEEIVPEISRWWDDLSAGEKRRLLSSHKVRLVGVVHALQCALDALEGR